MRKAILFFVICSLIILPFVNVLAVGTDYRYTGKPYDANTNLYYYGQRYYDPMSGRFTQPDPVSNNLANPQKLKQSTDQDLQKFLENPQNLNSYSYTVNNPVRYIDPTGEWWKEFFTGKQSLSGLYGEIGEASMYVNPVMSKVIDHPYLSGTVIAVGTPLIASGISSLVYGTSFLVNLGLMSAPLTSSSFSVTNAFNKINKATEGAYDIAKSGGKNFGLIENAKKLGQTAAQLQRGISSLQARVMEHLNYIKDPSTYKNYQQFLQQSELGQLQTKEFWYNEAIRYSAESRVLQGILKELK